MTIFDINPRWGDIINVIEDKLRITKGKIYSKSGNVIVKNSEAVASYIENLVDVILKNEFGNLKKNSGETVAFYENISDLRKKIKKLRRHIKDFQFSFIENSPSYKKCQRFSQQILRCHLISEEVVAAFEELAPYTQVLDLEHANLASPDYKDLIPFMKKSQEVKEDMFPIDAFLKAFEQINEEQKNWVSLSDLEHLYIYQNQLFAESKEKTLEEFLSDSFVDLHRYLALHKEISYISPESILRLIKAAASSDRCHELQFSKSILIPKIRDLVIEKGYSEFRGYGDAFIVYRKPAMLGWRYIDLNCKSRKYMLPRSKRCGAGIHLNKSGSNFRIFMN